MAMKIEKSTFGATKQGKSVSCYTIYTPDLRVKLLDYGATVQSLFVKDNDGKWVDVVLGYDTIREYEDNDGYFGACIGRIGNRIGGARFTLNGNTYSLYKNDGENHLHGGQHGFNSYIWQAGEVENGWRRRLSRHAARQRHLFDSRKHTDVGLSGTVRRRYTLQSDKSYIFQSERERNSS